MLAACALALLTAPTVCPPPEPGILDRIAEARAPFAHLTPADPPPAPEPAPEPEPVGEVDEPWATLADCESGDWIDNGAAFVPGSARWRSGHPDPELDERPPWSSGLFYGGLQFELDSWAWAAEVGGHDVPGNPAAATPAEQVAVASTLRDIHPAGWGAWPRCSRLIGLRD